MQTYPNFAPYDHAIMRTDGNAYALATTTQDRHYLMVAALRTDGSIDPDSWCEMEPQSHNEKMFMLATMQALKSLAASRTQRDVPVILHPVTIVRSKTMHHGNLELRLNRDTKFDVYTISVYRYNDHSEYDLWGVWDLNDLAAASDKYDGIVL